MWPVAYFTAVISRTGRSWRARDVEVDEAQSLDELVDALRSVAVDDQPVLAVVEHEDEWFAIVRVDGEEEPRLFVSDLAAASHSAYAEILAPAADVDAPDDEPEEGGGEGAGGEGGGVGPAADADPDSQAEDDDEDDEDEEVEPVIAVWAGESDLLEDLGVTSRILRKLVDDNADDPGAVLAEVGETAGFADLLEALR